MIKTNAKVGSPCSSWNRIGSVVTVVTLIIRLSKAIEGGDLRAGSCGQADEQYTRTPYYGVLRMTEWLQREGWEMNPKRVRRLLRDLAIERVDQVWSADITYIRMARNWLYLVAVIDWFSRYLLIWRLATSLQSDFCVEALDEALRHRRGRRPRIFNTDQGSQFTSETFTGRLTAQGVDIGMDGRSRCLDHIFIERLWRSVKYEEVYLKDYQRYAEAQHELGRYFRHYNHERPHQALAYRTPAEVYGASERA